MAERRMFARTIVLSDAFLDMSLGARCLYMTLGMVADDDGFVNNPKSIMRQCGAQEDDLRLLLAKKFLIPFDSGVVVIKHWRINNYLQRDRYRETKYTDEKAALEIEPNGAYHRIDPAAPEAITDSTVYTPPVSTQDRIGKDRIGKDIVEPSDEGSCRPDVRQKIITAWNALGLSTITKIVPETTRYKQLNARLRQYGEEKVLEAIAQIPKSSFLQGQNNRGWIITFDWLIKPNNFCKVLDGNYSDHAAGAAPAGRAPAQGTSTADRLLRMAQEGAFDNDPK